MRRVADTSARVPVVDPEARREEGEVPLRWDEHGPAACDTAAQAKEGQDELRGGRAPLGGSGRWECGAGRRFGRVGMRKWRMGGRTGRRGWYALSCGGEGGGGWRPVIRIADRAGLRPPAAACRARAALTSKSNPARPSSSTRPACSLARPLSVPPVSRLPACLRLSHAPKLYIRTLISRCWFVPSGLFICLSACLSFSPSPPHFRFLFGVALRVFLLLFLSIFSFLFYGIGFFFFCLTCCELLAETATLAPGDCVCVRVCYGVCLASVQKQMV